jgi:hypothetical protein
MILDFEKNIKATEVRKREIIVDFYKSMDFKSNRLEVEYVPPYGDGFSENLEILEVGIDNLIVIWCGEAALIPLSEVKYVFVKEINKK